MLAASPSRKRRTHGFHQAGSRADSFATQMNGTSGGVKRSRTVSAVREGPFSKGARRGAPSVISIPVQNKLGDTSPLKGPTRRGDGAHRPEVMKDPTSGGVTRRQGASAVREGPFSKTARRGAPPVISIPVQNKLRDTSPLKGPTPPD
jgi:hypothetical protein